MKDYYEILGIPENGSEADIKKAFRKLAFQHHPDTNPGHEKDAESKFKEINEAFGVLGDKDKRRQYDSFRRGHFASTGWEQGYPGFQYSQQDIFNGIFANQAMFDEMNRMFTQAGLRFDRDFLNRVFFSGRGFTFQFFTGPGGTAEQVYGNNVAYRPGWLERQLSKVAYKLGKFVLGRLFKYEARPGQGLDHHATLELTPAEAAAGGEKPVACQRGGKVKNLMVKVPARVKTGTRIRLKGMGMIAGKKSGDLYLHIKISG
jgi:DnaJ-class molecular chaperone